MMIGTIDRTPPRHPFTFERTECASRHRARFHIYDGPGENAQRIGQVVRWRTKGRWQIECRLSTGRSFFVRGHTDYREAETSFIRLLLDIHEGRA